MTTPTTPGTVDNIIRMAMRHAGKLAKYADPSSEDMAENLLRLNTLTNFLQTQGLKLWTQTDLSIPLTAGTALYPISPTGTVVMTKPLRAIQGYYLDSNSVRRPLMPISREEYTRLSSTTNEGAISSYFVDKQKTSLNVYFWNTPDTEAATGTCHLIIQQQMTQMVALTDSMAFPLEWELALQWSLADEICTGAPQAIMDRCAERRTYYLDALQNWDVEDAGTRFEPDTTLSSYGGGNGFA